MTVDAFIDYLQKEAGSALRVVSWYSSDEFGGIYVRNDLDREAVIERIQFLSERLVGRVKPVEGSPLEDLGEEQAMVQVREQVVILRFPTATDQGLVISLDIDAARDLHGFVLECSERLDGASLSFRSSVITA